MSANQEHVPFDQLDPLRQQVVRDRAARMLRDAAEKKQRALEALQALSVEAKRRKCETLKGFIETFWHVVEPVQMLKWNWHLDVVSYVLQEQANDNPEYARLVINVPPGTMKSLMLTFRRAWVWRKKPDARFLSGSYGASLSVRDNVKLRDIVESKLYKQLFPGTTLTDTVNKKERFDTTAHGWSIATSVGGPGTGEHPDFVDVDDPITEVQSRSKADRDAANNWVSRTLGSRGIARGVKFTLAMQRLHDEDPTGFMLRQGGVHHVKFPMEYEGIIRTESGAEEYPDPRDIRTRKGELLWPSLFTPEKVQQLKIALASDFAIAGQLQQRPSPEGGGLFRREWFHIVDSLPANIHRSARGWDTGGTEDGDPTCGVRIDEVLIRRATKKDEPDLYHYYISSVVRDQTENADALILATAELDGKDVEVREEKEPGSAGLAVVRSRANLLRGWSYEHVVVTGDKVVRSKPFRSQCMAGNVFLLRGEWNEKYLDELTHFPAGSNDDQVDASSCAFNALLMERKRQSRATWGR